MSEVLNYFGTSGENVSFNMVWIQGMERILQTSMEQGLFWKGGMGVGLWNECGPEVRTL